MLFRAWECDQHFAPIGTSSEEFSVYLRSLIGNPAISWRQLYRTQCDYIITMQVFDFSPMKLSLNTCVNLLALNGKCVPLRLNARIHSFRASNDLLISAPSIPGKKRMLVDFEIVRHVSN